MDELVRDLTRPIDNHLGKTEEIQGANVVTLITRRRQKDGVRSSGAAIRAVPAGPLWRSHGTKTFLNDRGRISLFKPN
jgi:hypothetical protein